LNWPVATCHVEFVESVCTRPGMIVGNDVAAPDVVRVGDELRDVGKARGGPGLVFAGEHVVDVVQEQRRGAHHREVVRRRPG